MRIRAIDIEWTGLAVHLAPFVSKLQMFVTPGAEYVVHALSVYKKVVFVLIVDDTESPVFVPSSLFETVSNDVPADWKCNLIAECEVELVVGPDFIAKDLNAYNGMIDHESDQIARFWNRMREMRDDSAAK